MRCFTRLAALVVLIVFSARADDAYFDVLLSDVKFDQALPAPSTQPDWSQWRKREAMAPRVVVENGEGFVKLTENERFARMPMEVAPGAHLVVRAPSNQDAKGTLYIASSDLSGMIPLHFTLPASSAKVEAKNAFNQALIAYCNSQMDRDRAGLPYFQYRIKQAEKELTEDQREEARQFIRPGRVTELERTFDLFTGSRAVAENLQLDRSLATTQEGDATIDVDSITGINVAAMDFKAAIKDVSPQLDPLAKYIPGDQHAIFFPSFDSFSRVMNESNRISDALFNTADLRGEDAGVRARYEKQLGLELSILSKLLGPTMVSSVAVTGGDPYVVAGTDLAILFEAMEPVALRTLLQGKIALSTMGTPTNSAIEGIECAVFRDDAKGVRCYIATLDNAVLVTNSQAQVKSIAAAKAKEDASLLKAPEYVFFRNRYALGDKSEDAFLILTDATIRRWCGAKWRIGDSRRVRALSRLLDERCGKIDDYAKANTSITASDPYGSVEFLTPISELDLSKVSEQEKGAYEAWRRQYQNYWRGMFDPIAARLTVNDEKLAVDLSVMPLIAGTDYRQFIDLTTGVKILPGSGDMHGAALHYIIAINAKSGLMRSLNTYAMAFAPKAGVDPLGWIGPTVSIYADEDPFWDQLGKLKGSEAEDFLRKNGYAFPAAVFVESSSALKLAAFVTAARAFIEQSAPNMTQWETKQTGDLSYVRVSASEQAKADMREAENISLFYATTGKGLVLSLNEKTLVSGLERLSGMSTNRPTTQPWLGESIAGQAKAAWIHAFDALMGQSYSEDLQQRAWSSLVILNEWKRLFPDQDPIKVHQRIFGTMITNPGGGDYSWNEKFQTMQSSTFGHPGEPKMVELKPEILNLVGDVNAGVTFENQGLRAKGEMLRGK
jgi:hypothetical protein